MELKKTSRSRVLSIPMCALLFVVGVFVAPQTTSAQAFGVVTIEPGISCSDTSYTYNNSSRMCEKRTSSISQVTPTYSCPSGFSYSSSRATCEKQVASLHTHARIPVCSSGYSYISSRHRCEKLTTQTTASGLRCPNGKILHNGVCKVRLGGHQCLSDSRAVRDCRFDQSRKYYAVLEEGDYIDEFKWNGANIGDYGDSDWVGAVGGYYYWVGNYVRNKVVYDSDDESISFDYYQACRCDSDQLVFSSNATRTCPSGYTYNSAANNCRRHVTLTQTPTYRCNSGYSYNSSQQRCERTVTSTVTAARIVNCASAYQHNSSSGYCEKTVYTTATAPPVHGCGIGGYTYRAASGLCEKSLLGLPSTRTYASGYSAAHPTSGEVVGTLAGEVSVGAGGNASYSIPIPVPQGVGGHTPGVSLDYSSASGNGLVGVGWTLNAGAGDIQRCGQTQRYDNAEHAVNFSSRDRFCVGTSRLVLVAGTYGAPNSEYALEIDDFSRYRAVGGSIGHPSYFSRTSKDGAVTIYGDTANTRRLTNDNQHIMSWAVSKRRDLSNNLISYTYHNADRNFYVTRVNYAYVNGSPHSFVAFHYANRPDPSSRFLHGSERRRDKRLSRITVHNNGRDIKSITLDYLPASAQLNKLSRVSSIQECAGTLCLPKSRFEWSQNTAGFSNTASFSIDTGYVYRWQVVDLNKDGNDDIVYVAATTARTNSWTLYKMMGHGTGFDSPIALTSGQARSMTLINDSLDIFDANGDGIEDIFYGNGLHARFVSALSAGAISHPPVAMRMGVTPKKKNEVRMMDINRDGWPDIVKNGAVSSVYAGVPGIYDRRMTTLEVQLGQAATVSGEPRFASAYIVQLPTQIAGIEVAYEPNVFALGNFDHDRHAEVAVARKGGSAVVVDIPLSAGAANIVMPAVPVSVTSHTRMLPGDLNRDGITDLVTLSCLAQDPGACDELELHYTLLGGDAPNAVLLRDDFYNYQEVFLSDYDADGHPDVWMDGGVSYLWRDEGFVAHTAAGDPTQETYPNGYNKHTTKFVRLGNSGQVYMAREHSKRADLGGSNPPPNTPVSGTIAFYASNNDAPMAKITGFVNGLGARTEVDYEDIAHSSHYKAAAHIGSGATPMKDTLCLQTHVGGCATIYDGRTENSAQLNARLVEGAAIPPGAEHQANPGRVRDRYAGRSIVTKVRRFTPVATSVGNQSVQAVEKHYHYGRARNHSTYGNLGFETMVTVDVASGLETQNVYRQDFPFVGMPYITQIRRTHDGRVLSTRYTELSFKGHTRPYNLYAKKITEAAYNQHNGEVIKAVVTTTDIDAWGNASSTKAVTRGEDGEVRDITVTNTFRNNTDRRYGRVDTVTTVNATEVGNDTDRRHHKMRYTYTNTGLLSSVITEPDKLAYTSTLTYSRDSAGNVIQETLSAPNLSHRVSKTEYDSHKRFITRTRDGNNHVVSDVKQRNHLGQVTEVADANGRIMTSYVNALGQPVGTSDNVGGWSRLSRQWCTHNSCRDRAVFRLTTTGADGRWIREHRDAWGRTLRTETPGFDGRTVRVDTDWDSAGRITHVSTPYFAGNNTAWTRYEYNDALGRQTAVERPGQRRETTHYHGFTITRRNGLGQVRIERKNAFDQVIEVEDHEGGRQSHRFDADGNVRFSTSHGNPGDPKTIVTEMRYDDLGRRTVLADPDKGTWTYTYNAYGEVLTQTDAVGNRQVSAYDALGRLLRRTDYDTQNSVVGHSRWYFDGAAPNGATYSDAIGQISGVVHSKNTRHESCTNSTTEVCDIPMYDGYGRPVKHLRALGASGNIATYTTGVSYDTIGRVVESHDALHGLTGNSGTRAAFNAYGYNTATYDLASGDMLYEVTAINARSQVTAARHGNGVSQSFTFNAATGRIEQQRGADRFHYEIQNIQYRWDTLGNLTYRHNASGDNDAARGLHKHNIRETFCYDNLNRLIKVRSGDTHCNSISSADQDVRYDSLGNIRYKKNVGTYTYGSRAGYHAGAHAVSHTSTGNISYRYDANGNLTRDNQRTLHYTVFDKPSVIEHSAGGRTEINYDADRARWQRRDTKNGVVTTTHYLGSVEKITKSNSSVIEWKRYAAKAVIALKTDTNLRTTALTRHYILSDNQRSPDVITDEIGAVSESMAFDAWGQRRYARTGAAMATSALLSFDTSTTTRGYTGHEMLDETGLIHMNGRVYDPMLARFVSADMLVPDPMDTQSYNRYAYVRNRPMFAIDANGFEGDACADTACEETKVVAPHTKEDVENNAARQAAEQQFADSLQGVLDELFGVGNTESWTDSEGNFAVRYNENGVSQDLVVTNGQVISGTTKAVTKFAHQSARQPRHALKSLRRAGGSWGTVVTGGASAPTLHSIQNACGGSLDCHKAVTLKASFYYALINVAGISATAAVGACASNLACNALALATIEAEFGVGKGVAKSGDKFTTEIVKRNKPGRDGGQSQHIKEKVNGTTTSTTHQVTLDGKVIHQHQDHIGKHGTVRRFSDELTGTKTINAPTTKDTMSGGPLGFPAKTPPSVHPSGL